MWRECGGENVFPSHCTILFRRTNYLLQSEIPQKPSFNEQLQLLAKGKIILQCKQTHSRNAWLNSWLSWPADYLALCCRSLSLIMLSCPIYYPHVLLHCVGRSEPWLWKIYFSFIFNTGWDCSHVILVMWWWTHSRHKGSHVGKWTGLNVWLEVGQGLRPSKKIKHSSRSPLNLAELSIEL